MKSIEPIFREIRVKREVPEKSVQYIQQMAKINASHLLGNESKSSVGTMSVSDPGTSVEEVVGSSNRN